jgi:two-component system response regulator FixJ
MTATVFVVDDDAAVRDALTRFFETHGMRVRSYPGGQEFLSVAGDDLRGCVVLDLDMPQINGLQVQSALRDLGSHIPVIFLTGKGAVHSAVRALKTGAVDFLEKPFQGPVLLERVQEALWMDAELTRKSAIRAEARRKLAELTARERDVLTRAIAGHSNKSIARQLAISYRTVETHRQGILRKTGATTIMQLAGLVEASESHLDEGDQSAGRTPK